MIYLLIWSPFIVISLLRLLKRLVQPKQYVIDIKAYYTDGIFEYDDVIYAFKKEMAAKEFVHRIRQTPIRDRLDWKKVLKYVHEG